MKPGWIRWIAAATLAAASAASHAAPFAYLALANGQVAVIDTATRVVSANITVAGVPAGITVLPLGRYAYVANASGYVSVIDSVAQGLVANIAVPAAAAGIAMNPLGTRAWVVHPGAVSVLNLETNTMFATIAVGAGSEGVVVSPSGGRVYVSNKTGNSISVIDAAAGTVVATIPVADGPSGMTLNGGGSRLYVAHFGNGAAGSSVSVIDTATNAVVGSIAVGLRPDGVAINPANTRLYVANSASNSVSVIDAATNAVLTTVAVGPQPSGIAVTPRGSEVYAPNSGNGTVSVIDVATNLVLPTITVGSTPRARGNFIGAELTSAPDQVGVLSGLWWNPAESGWGIHLTQRRNIIFAAWFTYDAAGGPKWYVASNCTMPPLACPTCVENTMCAGELHQVTGPRFFSEPFNPARVQATPAGVLQIQFRDRDTAEMSYTVGGNSRAVAIRRQVFQGGTFPPAVNYSDLWWTPTESGWGMGITQQYGMMFLTWFVYNDAGQPVWYVASNCAVSNNGHGCTGTLYRTMGPPGPSATNIFDPTRVVAVAVGSITLTFFDPNSGTMSYTVDGRPGSRNITRQVF